jgi:hypothetical protein
MPTYAHSPVNVATTVEPVLGSGVVNISSECRSIHPAEAYVYANFKDNRTDIHCTSINRKTSIYAFVAGSNVKAIESLRNKVFGGL